MHARLLLLVICLIASRAFSFTNFDQCFDDIKKDNSTMSGWRDNHGHAVTDINKLTAISYKLCVDRCGTGIEAFKWTVFSQQFSNWVLPWLALLSQIPFGARNRYDNIKGAILTLGSPALATYSLTLTVLNGYWIAERYQSVKHRHKRHAVRVLSGLQQVALRISTNANLLSSLVRLPENDKFWQTLDEKLDAEASTWNVPAAASIIWVLVAYAFTIIASFEDIEGGFNSWGQAVGSAWCWLVAVVTGWLLISPKCNQKRVESAIVHANEHAFVHDESGVVRPLAPHEDHAFDVTASDDSLFTDEKASQPVYNYARFLPWTEAVEQVREELNRAVHDNSPPASAPAFDSVAFPVHNQAWPLSGTWRNRVGSEARLLLSPFPSRKKWGPAIWKRLGVATLAAVCLQWATTGAAIIVHYFTPAMGWGCRSLSYLIYGGLSTVVLGLLMLSSLLAHSASPYPAADPLGRPHSTTQQVCAVFAVGLRRVGHFLAAVNAFGFIVGCIFHFTNVYDTCYCNSTVPGLGAARAFFVFHLTHQDISGMTVAYAVGVSLSVVSAVVFIGFVSMFTDPPAPD
ncbi:hypothetical protein PUNSTDRAFT_109378 [Punctularia strigosozonata HHB-11173 SS5]|uniref:Uncharacterized protein n=1 Tax=Punctularia strigosozonata (strain HHB-11173) TaxID=741275 RepID=R7RZF1_PUNST|nr:uncharacterized protein PUNSTDRAFT_109378 [Punctularia strigosozonata HHB-11173 SS5]EIN03495.1 hypothetical protein PUNSTDRAFT_109378 [Punctularia strigosozonata HHB-11173 SS5]